MEGAIIVRAIRRLGTSPESWGAFFGKREALGRFSPWGGA
jgi:hypothetical protein